ncbi:MAG: recombinase family protein [Deltaproteobacteria bacterium]|nr:recombinase family protein [Deltaproteobacteria bacterium]
MAKKGFSDWVKEKIGPDGRRISVLLNGEDFKIWIGLQQQGESHNATMHRVIREVSGHAGGDVLFEIKGLLTRLMGEVSALRDDVQCLKRVSADESAVINPPAEVCISANESVDNISAEASTIETQSGHDDISASNSAEYLSAKLSAEPVEPSVFSAKVSTEIQPAFSTADSVLIISAVNGAEQVSKGGLSAGDSATQREIISAEVGADDTHHKAEHQEQPGPETADYPQAESQETPTSPAEPQEQPEPAHADYQEPTPPVAETQIHPELIGLKINLANGDRREDVLPELVKVIAFWNSEGVSQIEIANRLDQAGIPTLKGGRWSQSTISCMLKALKGKGKKLSQGRMSRATLFDHPRGQIN